ncbi:hypothetical protein [Saccharopolyspora gloriosae]|uniref:hypothetical protein n=1 Tax=Saccharopolyspora gloriosae TaxID=455344 RepID=UPI001FB8010C|nr:hypothetical protein [Saccharopolyspora gloriosae]
MDPGAVQHETRLRADLGLDSTETAQLEIELRERSVFNVDLWDSHDYTVAELADSLPDH